MTLATCLGTGVVWRRAETAEFPYAAEVAGRSWAIRVNDFPAEPMYSLYIDGAEIGDFDDWPGCWQRPG